MRRILHIDMDAFYASVEQRDNPALARQAARGRRTARIAAASSRRPATKRGRSASGRRCRWRKPSASAHRSSSSLPTSRATQAASSTIFDIYREVTPLVEPLSLDEAYLDVTENSWNEPLATTVAKRLKARIREETGLTASAGVAPNKFLAKIASGWKKPDGLTVIPPDRVEPFLQQLPVDALWGVGPVTARKLRARGITQLIDVRAIDERVLREAVGSMADWLRAAGKWHRRQAGCPAPRGEVIGVGKHVSAGPHRPGNYPGRSRADGARRGIVVGAQGPVRPHGDDQGALCGFHDGHAKPHNGRNPRGRRTRPPGCAAARANRRRPASCPAAGGERSQPVYGSH